MFSLDDPLQPGQGVRPELGQQLPHRLERLPAQCIQPPGSLAPLGEQAGVLEHADVLADRLLGEREACGDLPGRQFGMLDQAQDPPAVRIGKRSQYRVGCRWCRPRISGHVGGVQAANGVPIPVLSSDSMLAKK